jgi:hypothetical protein
VNPLTLLFGHSRGERLDLVFKFDSDRIILDMSPLGRQLFLVSKKKSPGKDRNSPRLRPASKNLSGTFLVSFD